MRVEYFKGQERLRDWLHWKIRALVGVLETLVHCLVTERVTIGCCAGAAVRTKLEHNLAYHFDSALRRGSFNNVTFNNFTTLHVQLLKTKYFCLVSQFQAEKDLFYYLLHKKTKWLLTLQCEAWNHPNYQLSKALLCAVSYSYRTITILIAIVPSVHVTSMTRWMNCDSCVLRSTIMSYVCWMERTLTHMTLNNSLTRSLTLTSRLYFARLSNASSGQSLKIPQSLKNQRDGKYNAVKIPSYGWHS